MGDLWANTPGLSQGRCVTFWYYITGEQPGALIFYIRDKVNKEAIVWRLQTSKSDNSWQFGSFGFYMEESYRIEIQATRGSSPGSIGVDDIWIKDSQYCSTLPPDAQDGQGLPTPATTTASTTTARPTVYDCDFERDYCNWMNDGTQKATWVRNQGNTLNSNTGPAVDHT